MNNNQNQTINTQQQVNNQIQNNNLQKNIENNYQPPSKSKIIMLLILFCLILGFVIFLPEISLMINKYKKGEYKEEEKILTGKLNCFLATTTKNLDKEYSLVFSYIDNKLKQTEYIITTKGDMSKDEKELSEILDNCKTISKYTKEISNVSIKCDSTNNKVVESQTYDLNGLDFEALTKAFIEAGGNYPEYKYNQDMDNIEREMNAAGYSCKREA